MSDMQHRLKGIEERLLPDECRVAAKVLAAAQRLLASPPALPEAGKSPFVTANLTDAWVDAQLAAKDAADRAQRRRAVLMELIESARARSATAAAEVRDQILHGYHRELTLLLDDVRDVAAELDGVTSAEHAIAADRGPAWKRLCGLADDYATLRAAQLALDGPRHGHQVEAVQWRRRTRIRPAPPQP